MDASLPYNHLEASEDVSPFFFHREVDWTRIPPKKNGGKTLDVFWVFLPPKPPKKNEEKNLLQERNRGFKCGCLFYTFICS